MCDKNHFLYIVFIFCLLSTGISQAVVIEFEDLEKEHPSEVIQLTDQYASKGIIFTNAYLHDWASNKLITGPAVSFYFIGILPVYVSFILNNSEELKNSIHAQGPNGYSEILSTEGWVRGMSPENGTPYVPDQQVTLQSEFGISSVWVGSQSSPYLDDLVFHYKADVPEPGVLMLFLVGLLGVTVHRLI